MSEPLDTESLDTFILEHEDGHGLEVNYDSDGEVVALVVVDEEMDEIAAYDGEHLEDLTVTGLAAQAAPNESGQAGAVYYEPKHD